MRRILVHNVRGFENGVAPVAAVVEAEEPDVALVQECGRPTRLRAFARAVGMTRVSAPHEPWRRGLHLAALVRPPWTVLDHRAVRFAGSAPLSPRGVLVTRVGAGDAAIWALSSHLGLRAGERRRHADHLAGLAARLDGPIVLGVDLNERPAGRAARRLAGELRDVWPAAGRGPGRTFPADAPAARIDACFVSAEWIPVAAWVPGGPGVVGASDHRPLVVDLELGPEASAGG